MAEQKIKDIKVEMVDIKQLHPNKGQVDGLHKNPRFIKDDKFEKLVNSLRENPEMMQLREVIAYDNGGELVIICGNMRYRAAKEIGLKEVPCKILPQDTDVDKLKAYTIKDNASFGENDWGLLANEWDEAQLEDWGVDMPIFEPKETGEKDEDDSEDEKGYKVAYELVFNDEAEQTEFYDLLKELKSNLQDYDTISERILVALRFWKDNYEQN